MPMNKMWKIKSQIMECPYVLICPISSGLLKMLLTYPVRWLPRTRLKRVAVKRLGGYFAATVAAIGISLCIPAHAFAPIASKSLDPKEYAKLYVTNNKQYQCLLKLYTLESNWNPKAHNKSGAYGIPQMLNPLMKYKTANEQVWYGMKYIRYRYGVDEDMNPMACIALNHLLKYGWH